MKKLVSIVIPAFNEEENLITIIDRIEKVFECLGYNFEIIIVDDGSSDNTINNLKNEIANKHHLYFIEFSRNFGHQAALMAGLNNANGDCVISMDADLQHPPEMLTQMLQKWEEGYEVVYTRRLPDPSLPFKKRKFSELFYKLLNSLSDVEIESGTADFRLLDKIVVKNLNQFKEMDPFVRGLVKLVGFKQFAIDYIPAERFKGSSKYSLAKMRRLALHGVTSLSIKPLYTAVYLGFFFSFLSLLYIPYILFAFYEGTEVSGWASLIMTVVFFGGLQLIILGFLGIYLGKMFMQAKNRPNYIIRSTNIK
ncbi:glycosyl transferase family 2 [Pedobacter psychrophilus]|uniref:Glycosyl transferase family 2 n=1 Tax=Pedobacter psychrophilus TaxID=1826909 RepID=A0A179DF02_9SPHI|nr:glycosyltransferase family 2 protein [Pedobacter psychrophilus]OAQ39626.1 glycosyl transferase family 2 [Pedobacter psychrophilus]